MPKIIIAGKDLNDCTLAEAFLAGADPERAIFDAGDRLDYNRNLELLAMFGDRDQMGVDLAVGRYAAIARGFFGEPFNALRAGEVMTWSIRHGLVERVDGPAWRLLVRERQFELVGPETKQRAARVRGFTGAEAVLAAKLWDRELKRRAKAEAKRVAFVADLTGKGLAYIAKHEPDLKLTPGLEQFVVGAIDTFAGAADYITDTIRVSALVDARKIGDLIDTTYRDVCARQTEKGAAARRAAREAEYAQSLAELDAFRLSNPPPPPRVPTAKVEWTVTASEELCVITGTYDGVQAEAEHWRQEMRGWNMGVRSPVEIAPGVWQAHGSHDR